MFPKAQVRTKGEAFFDSTELQAAIQRQLRYLSENTLLKELQNLKNHFETVIQSGGDYISTIDRHFYSPILIYVFYLSNAIIFRMP